MAVPPTHSAGTRERLVLQEFWILLALGSAVASWRLGTWLLRPGPLMWPSWTEIGVILALASVVRTAAKILNRPLLPPVPIPSLCRAILGVGFSSVTTLAAFLAAAGACFLGGWIAQNVGGFALANVASLPVGLDGLAFRPIGLATIAASLAAQLYGFTIGFRRLQVRELSLPVANLPAAFDGYRILHLSDIHVGPFCHHATLRRALARAQALQPDLVCCTGDVVDTPSTNLVEWLPELRALSAPDGVLTILGNHDRHADADRVAAALRQHTPWRVLRNEVATVTRGHDHLHLLGIEDAPQSDAANTTTRLVRALPSGATVIALIHHPGVFDHIAALGLPLVLAGHSHGGQLALPFAPHVNAARLLGIHRSVGAFSQAGSRLFVSRGLGTSGQRVRVGAPAELTVFRLVAAPPSSLPNPLTPLGGAVS